MQITIGDKVFKTKSDATKHYKSILNSYELGQTLNEQDYEDVMSLLVLHPSYTSKAGSGIVGIYVGDTDYFANRCFHIRRSDGTTEDFSYGKCLSGELPEYTSFSKACKKTVENNVFWWKENYFKKHQVNNTMKCSITNEDITWEQCRATHDPSTTLASIVRGFIDEEKIDLSKVKYKKDGEYGWNLEDEDLIKKFRSYHRKNSKLRISKAFKCNQS